MTPTGRRQAGVLVPLFSLRAERGWGIGEIGDVGPFCAWLASAGHHLLQLLPVNEMSPGERSPYSALTAFAIDPIYLSVPQVEDFVAAGGEAALPPVTRALLDTARADRTIDYHRIRVVKRQAVEVGFTHFLATEERTGSARARAFRRFEDEQAGWLREYTLFRACHERHAGRAWTTWESSVRDRLPTALVAMRATLADACRFHAYVQWIAAEQWGAARREASAVGVQLIGDLPFMVGRDSADLWARQDEFRLDAVLGAPPDAFNAQGQDWGLPVCRWDKMAAGDFAWLRSRIGRAATLFDLLRLDHVVGFYRMYVIPSVGTATFIPEMEAEQLALGVQLLGVALAAAGGTPLLGEDLGVVPALVRRSLSSLGIPGYRVLRWESDAGVFRDPTSYPALSVATTGTHDTSSLATWWTEELDDDGRQSLAAVASFGTLQNAGAEFTPAVHEALLAGLYGAGSDLVVIPFPDAYGGQERVNVPATVGPWNWSYRLPWTLGELAGQVGRQLGDRLRTIAVRSGR